jgi:integrase
MEAYVTYRKASGQWNNSHEQNLLYFDRYCSRMYPGAETPAQEMVDSWCAQRVTENNNSCISRIGVVSGFIKYMRVRGKTDIAGPVFPKKERRTYIPHAFAVSELEKFFRACDDLPSEPRLPSVLTRKITLPVFFRLLYSSGIRTNEARMLRVDDVDLEQGILSIRKSKGEPQHYAALHDSMLELLRKYDVAIQKIYPERQYFFPSPKGFYRSNWVCRNFRELWYTHNTSHATAYDLRHHYATENINQWIGYGFDFDSKLLYLSKSMGHSVLESTRYYYSLTPVLADVIDKLSRRDFDDIVPEVDDEESL